MTSREVTPKAIAYTVVYSKEGKPTASCVYASNAAAAVKMASMLDDIELKPSDCSVFPGWHNIEAVY